MKLSDAIRLGAMLKPQGFGGKKDNTDIFSGSVTCALGAAGEALGIEWFGSAPFFELCDVYPWLSRQTTCPACGDDALGAFGRGEFFSVIFHLNDKHRWTREQIADWVSTIEPEGEPHDTSLDAPAVAAGVTA